MAVVVSMLRGINVGGYDKIKMEEREELSRLVFNIKMAVEQRFGFRPGSLHRRTPIQ